MDWDWKVKIWAHFYRNPQNRCILSNVYSTWDVWLCLLGWTELCISQEGKPFRLLDIKTLLYCQSELFSRLAFANLIHQGKPRLQYEKCQLFWKRTTTDANVFNIPIQILWHISPLANKLFNCKICSWSLKSCQSLQRNHSQVM